MSQQLQFAPLPKRYPLWRTWNARFGGWTTTITGPTLPEHRLSLITTWNHQTLQHKLHLTIWITQKDHPSACRYDGSGPQLGDGPSIDATSLILPDPLMPVIYPVLALQNARLSVEQLLLSNAPPLLNLLNQHNITYQTVIQEQD